MRRFAVLLVLLAVPLLRLSAQNVLMALYEDKPYPVVKVKGSRPFVEVGGKLVDADWRRFALAKVDEFLPVFIAVRSVQVRSSAANVRGSTINNEFHFQARFESPYPLDDVFLVLELHSELAQSTLFVREVGRLVPREDKLVEVTVPLAFHMGRGRYHLHLFSHGAEVLNSQIPEARREAVLDKMVARRIAGSKDAEPQPWLGPVPEYPESLLRSKVEGQAVIALRVGRNGRVIDPQVKQATQPLFGESSLAAIRMWRFLPKTVNGSTVESHVEVPFQFSPPVQRAAEP